MVQMSLESEGDKYLKEMDYDKAIIAYEKALDNASTQFIQHNIYEKMGELYFNIKKYNKAIECFNRIVHGAKREKKRKLWILMENSYTCLGNKEKAEECFNRRSLLKPKKESKKKAEKPIKDKSQKKNPQKKLKKVMKKLYERKPKKKDIDTLIERSMEKYWNEWSEQDEPNSPDPKQNKAKMKLSLKIYQQQQENRQNLIGRNKKEENIFQSDPKRWKFKHRPKRQRDRSNKKIEHQHIKWWLNRPPVNNEYALIRKFMRENGVIFIKDTHNSLHYRKFYPNGQSLHFIIYRKYWGLNISTHIDVESHVKYTYNKESLKLLSELYIFLKNKYGRVFMLPRQERFFQGFLGEWFKNKGIYAKKMRKLKRTSK